MGKVKISLFLALFVLGLAFTNAMKASPAPEKHSRNASQSFAQKVQKLIQEQRNQIDSQFCENSRNYVCMEKIFSSQDRKPQGSMDACVNLIQGGEICPYLQTRVYDSRSARESCQSGCQESYDYKEYDCHLKLRSANDDFYPLVATESTLEKAIEELHAVCLKVKGL